MLVIAAAAGLGRRHSDCSCGGMQVTDRTREDNRIRAGKLVNILNKIRYPKMLAKELEIGETLDVLLGNEFE